MDQIDKSFLKASLWVLFIMTFLCFMMVKINPLIINMHGDVFNQYHFYTHRSYGLSILRIYNIVYTNPIWLLLVPVFILVTIVIHVVLKRKKVRFFPRFVAISGTCLTVFIWFNYFSLMIGPIIKGI